MAHYAVFVGEGKNKPKRADIWVLPRINIWETLRGKSPRREKLIADLLLPHWKGVSTAQQKEIFSKIVVMFLDHATGNYYFARAVKDIPDNVFHAPTIPADYQTEHMDAAQLRKLGKEAEALFWQNMN